jgi:Mg-chelatase subunit ChlD
MAFITTGGQIGVRVPPTSDRAKLETAIAAFASQGGANAFLDSLLEADQCFLKNRPGAWPVFVMLITDSNSRQEFHIDQYNSFVNDFIARGGSAHAIVISDGKNGVVTDLAKHLAQNTGGIFEAMNLPNVLPDKMKAIATRLVADQHTMSSRYELEYRGEAKAGPVTVAVGREGLSLRLSPRRPF